METIVDILAIIIFVLVIFTVPRAVSNGTLKPGRSKVLTGFMIAVAIIFATVSVSAASGLAATNSGLAHLGVLAALVVIALVARSTWSARPSL